MLPKGWCIGETDSGWMDAKSFYEYFANVFIPYKKERFGEDAVVVFFDGHKSHTCLQLSQLAEENNIHLICLPPQATHILQPLDVAYFKPMKSYYPKVKGEFERDVKKNGRMEKYKWFWINIVTILLKVRNMVFALAVFIHSHQKRLTTQNV
jgi:hypothetical protein